MTLAGGAGVLSGLGQVPFSLESFGVAGLFAGLALFLVATTWRTAFATGWAFGTGYFALTLFWIVEPFLVDVARHGWMAPFALILMSGGLALFWGAAFALAHVVGTTPIRTAVAWAAMLSLAELARGYLLTGFPWALIGYIWTETEVLQWASVVGPHGLTGLTLGLVSVGWIAAYGRNIRWLAVLPVPISAMALSGASMTPGPPQVPSAPVIRLVQPNALQHEKWIPEKAAEFYRRQLEFTVAESIKPPDLIIWPETSIPWLLESAGSALAEISATAGVPVALGVQRREGDRFFNSLAVLGSGGELENLYDKHHLVPFGEFIPFGQITRAFGLRSFAARDGYGYSPGPGAQVLDLGPLGSALPLICYEAIFPQDVRLSPERPDWILQITNDAWFGKVSGPYQHLSQARVRAVEQGLPMIRVANTGVSAVIDANGRILASIPLGEAGWIDHPLPPARPATIYARTGDWPLLAVLLATLLVLRTPRVRLSD